MARTPKQAYTLDRAMVELREVSSKQVATIFTRRAPGIPVLGVKYGDLAAMQKQIEPSQAMGLL